MSGLTGAVTALDAAAVSGPSSLSVAALVVLPTLVWTLVAYLASPAGGRPLVDGPAEADAAGHVRKKTLAGLAMAAGALVSIAAAGLDVGSVLDARPNPRLAWLVAAATALVVLPVVARAAASPANLARYPEIRMRMWDAAWKKRAALTWFAYLAGYELLFRGALVLGLARLTDPVVALAVGTSLYVLAHLRKDAGETLSCFVMGPLFGWIALLGGVAPAVVLHVAIAVTAETFAIRAMDRRDRPTPS